MEIVSQPAGIDAAAADATVKSQFVAESPQRHEASLRIGQCRIGAPAPAYVIAEAGVNHNGSLKLARELIATAKDIGANAVKLQVFTATALTTEQAATAEYQRRNGEFSQRALLEELELSREQYSILRQHAAECGVDFIATPFGVADLAVLETLDVPAIKLASSDLIDVPLVRAAAARNLPLIVSTGAATGEEIERAVARLRLCGALERTVLLHCVSAYPTPNDHANLRRIRALASVFGVRVGYSDHTTSVEAGALAVAAGACVLEKHLTLDQSLPGPDHAASLEPAQFARYIERVREAERMLGSGMLDYDPIEANVRDVARKSVVLAEGLPAGTRLEPEHLTTKRPAGGISAESFDEVVGKTLTCDVPAEAVLQWDLLE